jgi:hypothetical protein
MGGCVSCVYEGGCVCVCAGLLVDACVCGITGGSVWVAAFVCVIVGGCVSVWEG